MDLYCEIEQRKVGSCQVMKERDTLRAEVERLTVVVSKCHKCCMELKDRAVGEQRFSDADRWREAMFAAPRQGGQREE
jgi:hypothetical protein